MEYIGIGICVIAVVAICVLIIQRKKNNQEANLGVDVTTDIKEHEIAVSNDAPAELVIEMEMLPVVANTAVAAMGVASMVVGQYYMTQINAKLDAISDGISEIQNFQDNEYRSRVFSLVAHVCHNHTGDPHDGFSNFLFVEGSSRFNDRMANAVSNQNFHCDFRIFLCGIRQIYNRTGNSVSHLVRVRRIHFFNHTLILSAPSAGAPSDHPGGLPPNIPWSSSP